MTVSTVASLHEIAQELLDAAEAAVADTVGGPVVEAFLSPGLPAFDRGCDIAVAWAGQLGMEATAPLAPAPAVGHRFQYGGWVNLPTLNVTVLRCVAVAQDQKGVYRVPSPDQLSADARKVMEDGWAIWNGVCRDILRGELFGGTCNDIKVQALIPVVPEGGLAGWTLNVAVELPGFDT